MTLAARITAGQASAGARVDTGGTTLGDAELVPGLAADLASGFAVSVGDAAQLIRLLAAADGQADAMLLLSPALSPEHTSTLMAEASLSRLVSDRADLAALTTLTPDAAVAPPHAPTVETDWLLTTSGTTGRPKIVRHRLASLLRTVKPAQVPPPIWGLLYEPTRFAGLQVVLQALTGGGRLIAPAFDAPMPERLTLLADRGVSHLSATPTLWRRILMDAPANLAPSQITLGGEIADRPVLAALAARFPEARIRHIYASTELGVGFSVRDGHPGFPRAWLESGRDGVDLRIREDTLWVRPPGAVPEGVAASALTPDDDGYFPTGDRVELTKDRVLFLGRDATTVNIGGTKIQPEAVERVLNEHPDIAIARIAHRPNPIAGSLLTLTLVPRDSQADPKTLRRAISAFCKERLPREAMPAQIKLVSELELNAAGKLTRGAA